MIWQAKATSAGTYADMKSPSTYDGDVEDLDSNSYRSTVTGNLIDKVVSQNWSKLKFNYKFLTPQEIQDLMTTLKINPLFVRAKDPALGSEWVEMKVRCSKKSWSMLEGQRGYTLSFNLVQKEKVAGQ